MFIIPAILAIVDMLILCYCYYLHAVVRKRISDDCDRLWSESNVWSTKIIDEYWDTRYPRLVKQ